MPISFLYFFLYIIFFNLKISFSYENDKKIDFLTGDFMKCFENKEVALSIFSERKNAAVFEFQQNRPLIPNSIVKILTSFVAFEHLGTDFKFENKLIGYGKIKDGVFYGSLQFIASGDPTFGSERFEGLSCCLSSLIESLKEKGIKEIDGEIKIKSPYLDKTFRPSCWPIEDIANYYGCGIYGFNIHDNLFSIEFAIANKKNKDTKILRVFPEIPSLIIDNKVKSGELDKTDRAVIFPGSSVNQLIIEGTLGRAQSSCQIKGAIPDPEEFFLYHLEKEMLKEGIKFHKNKVAEDKTIAFSISFFSPSLQEIVHQMNQKSINLYAEALLKKVCFEKICDSSFEQSANFLNKFLKAQTGGVFNLYDGSGLSPKNRVTTNSMVKAITAMSSKAYFSNLISTLPSSGGSATKIYKLFPEKEFENNLYAKTGFSSAGESLFGICYNKKGERFFFCAIENHLSFSDRALFYSKLKEALCFFCLS